MPKLAHVFVNNRRWADEKLSEDPNYFKRFAKGQKPPYLWIGCSDSRMPPNSVLGLEAGEVFVHRNIGNMVIHTDVNSLSVIQYAVEVLQVRHIIVCGHYGCGAVQAALKDRPLGLIDNWLRHIKDVHMKHHHTLDTIHAEQVRSDRLSELNVAEQLANVCYTTFVQDAWRRKQPLSVHGWIYNLGDGLIRDLGLCISKPSQLSPVYRMFLKSVSPQDHDQGDD